MAALSSLDSPPSGPDAGQHPAGQLIDPDLLEQVVLEGHGILPFRRLCPAIGLQSDVAHSFTAFRRIRRVSASHASYCAQLLLAIPPERLPAQCKDNPPVDRIETVGVYESHHCPRSASVDGIP